MKPAKSVADRRPAVEQSKQKGERLYEKTWNGRRAEKAMKTISAITLGCKVNQYDTNAMLGLFRAGGYEVLPWGTPTDIALVNTCTVTHIADRKSRAAVRQAARRGSAVCVCGCLAQKQKDALLAMEGVCWVVGTADRGGIVALVEAGTGRVMAGERPDYEELRLESPVERIRAFVKVQEGCDHFCSYCIIPYVRGRAQSRTRADVVAEVQRLCAAGVPEIVLTGIDLASYSSGGDLADLVLALEEYTPLGRLRLGSLEPGFLRYDVARRLARSQILCPHFHLSLQSGSDRVLRAMNRHYTAADYLQELDVLRTCFDHPAVSTDIMTGFPGEDDADFEQTEDLARRAAFSRLHVFPFSERDRTRAAGLPGTVPMHLRRERALRLIALGEQLEQAYARSLLTRQQAVLFEEEEDGLSAGYCERYVRVLAPGGRIGEVQTVRAETMAGASLRGAVETPGPQPC